MLILARSTRAGGPRQIGTSGLTVKGGLRRNIQAGGSKIRTTHSTGRTKLDLGKARRVEGRAGGEIRVDAPAGQARLGRLHVLEGYPKAQPGE